MPVIVTDAAEGPAGVRVTNTDTGESENVERDAEVIREAAQRVAQ
jgi:hypothetical protein